MSYCRFSSDDYASDLYVWDDVAGVIRVEVAGRRVVWHDDVTLPPPLPDGHDIGAWVKRDNAILALLDDESNYDWVDTPTPTDGHTQAWDTYAEAADAVERLAAEGFHVPDGVVESLRRDAADAPGAPASERRERA